VEVSLGIADKSRKSVGAGLVPALPEYLVSVVDVGGYPQGAPLQVLGKEKIFCFTSLYRWRLTPSRLRLPALRRSHKGQ
jgi:hypothetical protein